MWFIRTPLNASGSNVKNVLIHKGTWIMHRNTPTVLRPETTSFMTYLLLTTLKLLLLQHSTMHEECTFNVQQRVDFTKLCLPNKKCQAHRVWWKKCCSISPTFCLKMCWWDLPNQCTICSICLPYSNRNLPKKLISRQFHQHYTRTFFVRNFGAKSNVTREKLPNSLLYEKHVHKRLMKLTSCLQKKVGQKCWWNWPKDVALSKILSKVLSYIILFSKRKRSSLSFLLCFTFFLSLFTYFFKFLFLSKFKVNLFKMQVISTE